ncbi:MAG: hypothetical protein ACFFFT_16070 [Candidatus Thorarchaeota archaeon]
MNKYFNESKNLFDDLSNEATTDEALKRIKYSESTERIEDIKIEVDLEKLRTSKPKAYSKIIGYVAKQD